QRMRELTPEVSKDERIDALFVPEEGRQLEPHHGGAEASQIGVIEEGRKARRGRVARSHPLDRGLPSFDLESAKRLFEVQDRRKRGLVVLFEDAEARIAGRLVLST